MKEAILFTCKEKLIPHHEREHKRYEYLKYEITPESEFSQCYAAFYEIPPLKCSYPYHYHTQNTELFYIISGQGVMETPAGEQVLLPGMVAVCPPGEKSAHRIRNTSEKEALVYLDVDTANSPDIIHYPETGKNRDHPPQPVLYVF